MAVYSWVSFQEMFPVSLLYLSALLIYGGRCVYNGLSCNTCTYPITKKSLWSCEAQQNLSNPDTCGENSGVWGSCFSFRNWMCFGCIKMSEVSSLQGVLIRGALSCNLYMQTLLFMIYVILFSDWRFKGEHDCGASSEHTLSQLPQKTECCGRVQRWLVSILHMAPESPHNTQTAWILQWVKAIWRNCNLVTFGTERVMMRCPVEKYTFEAVGESCFLMSPDFRFSCGLEEFLCS